MEDGHGGKPVINQAEKEMPPSTKPSLLTV